MLPELPETIAPPHKPNLIYRALTRWTHLNLPLKLISMILFLGLCAAGLYYAVTDNGQIAYIGPSPTTIPLATPMSPPPFPSLPDCVSGVYSAEISYACSTQGFYNIKYQCSDGRSFVVGDGKTCIDIFDAGNQARKNCGESCAIQISPVPSPLVSPPPTADPSTSISCMPALYRIPAGSIIKPENLTEYLKPEYAVDPKNTTVKPGEFYLHGMKITNTSRQQISTAWSHFQMSGSPIQVDRTKDIQTQYTWANGCTIDSSDTIFCPVEHFSIPVGQSVVLNQPLYVTEITKTPPNESITSGYHIQLKSASSDYVIKDCGTEMMTINSTTPSISPSPSPKPTLYSCLYNCVIKERKPITTCRKQCSLPNY